MVRLYGVLALLVLAIVFVLQNTSVVTLRFLFWERSMSQIIVLLMTLVAGFLLGYLVSTLGRRKSS